MSGIGIDFQVFYDSVQGGRKYMEDVISVKMHSDGDSPDRRFAFFAVFDGHGGAEAAHFADKNLLHQILQRDEFWSEDDNEVVQAIKDGFISTHLMMAKAVDTWPTTATGLPSTAGTTASVAILRNKKLYVAHVGDSSVVIGEHVAKRHDGMLNAKCVTEDHKPDSNKERERIQKSGGEVLVKAGVSRVVWKRPREVSGPQRRTTVVDTIPFLAVARSLGDLWSYNRERDVYVVSPEPDVAVFNLDWRKQRCLVIASDGVWNMMSATYATGYISRWNRRSQQSKAVNGSGANVQQPAAGLVRLALDRWLMRGKSADNISAIVVMFLDPVHQSTDEPKPLAPTEPTSSRFRLGTRRVSLSSYMWRLPFAKRPFWSARGIVGPSETCDRLDSSTPRSAHLRREHYVANSTSELADAAVVPSAGKGLIQRHSCNDDCEHRRDDDGKSSDNDEDESLQSPKRIRCDTVDIVQSSALRLISASVPDISTTPTGIPSTSEGCTGRAVCRRRLLN